MSLLNYVKLPFSFRAGWDDMRAVHPSAWRTFLLMTLPFSLMPPALLITVGVQHGAQFLIEAPLRRWEMVAAIFLLAELLTVPLMALLMRYLAARHERAVSFADALRLAALTAVPMWLSALGLAIPALWALIGVILLGLFLAGSVLYRGSYAFLKLTDPIEAQSLASEVFAAGALVWVALCALVVLPLIA